MYKVGQLKELYEKYEERISIGSLLLGFVIDSFTLQRIDSLFENLWFLGNLVVAGTCIIVLNRMRSREGWKHFFVINLLQFDIGALLGGFFIFYFRSSALSTAWPFLLVLVFAMVANELFQKRYARLTFQLSFLYLAIFSFSIFILPLLFHYIGALIFLLSGVVSLATIWLFIKLLTHFAREKLLEEKTHVWSFIGVIFVCLNLLYFTNLIPPIPLSLKDIGVYHSVTKQGDGGYVVVGENKRFLDYLKFHEEVHWDGSKPLYIYSAIFSPGSLNTNIVHEWQYRAGDGEWVTSTRIPIFISGGRDDGFRTYSTKYNLSTGLWRVNIETPRGQLLGRKVFEVVLSDEVLDLEVKIER